MELGPAEAPVGRAGPSSISDLTQALPIDLRERQGTRY